MFVPHLAVNLAVLLAVLSIGVLVWFINHIADSIQIFTLSRQVRLATVTALTVPSPYRYDDAGRLRVIAPRTGLPELLDRVFDAVRLYATEHPMVLHRALALAEQVHRAGGEVDARDRLTAHIEQLVEAFERTSPQGCDRTDLRRHAATVHAALHRVDSVG
ncbi:MAG: DUF2254 domain-containing protein [Pseudonocardia sp.]|nr:DUF2254 domain-containing protein [Pseudonocardia sp.]